MVLIELLIVLLLLFVVGAAALYIIRQFNMPDPARLVVGAILLILLLVWVAYVIQGQGAVVFKRGV